MAESNDSSSSHHPRLNRHKWANQRRRRKRSKKFFGKTRREWCHIFKDCTLFYITFFLVLTSICSFFTTVFLVPFFVDPAWSTLRADFDPVGKECSTISGEFIRGTGLTCKSLHLSC